MPRVMNTIRERWSSSGHVVEMAGAVDDVLDAVEDDRPRLADVEQALDAEHVEAAAVQQHRQPDGERVPVERLVEHDG